VIRRALARSLGLASALLLAACGEPERDWPEPSPALWEVVSPEGERGWLFGTIHALPEEVRWRTPALENVLAGSGVLVVEIAEVGDAGAAAEAFERYAGGQGLVPLARRVPEADRADLSGLLERANMDQGDFAGTDTWAAALTLANRARRLEMDQNLDRSLVDAAGEVIGLESHEAQYALFDALPAKEQADLLLALARDTSGEQARIESWLTGDLAALEAASAPLLDDPELREALQAGRNRKWAPRIAALVEGGRRPFVAVGTAHLFGEDSLPALLEAQGYTVRRIQ
jgi:uncharacterized protein YbaP (TraB family)